MIRQRFNDRGAVALITTVIISILLSIVIIGVMIVMISELRQSNDNEQSIRAYYAAESGVEDAIVKLKAMGTTHTDQDCSSTSPSSKNLNIDSANPGVVGWSCQQIHFSGQPSGSLSESDKAVQIDLEGAPNFHSLTLEWDTGAPKNTAPVPSTLPSSTGWNNRPAALELAVVEYPDSTTFAASGIKIKNFLVLPAWSAYPDIPVDAPAGSNPWRGACSNSGTYHCKVTIENFNTPPASYMLRLRARYVGTDYKLTFYQGNNGVGATLAVPDGTATIDVTGKAGDVYRRVIYKVPFNKGAAVGLDYVLFSDSNICKDLSIIGGVASGPPGCGL